MPINRYFHSDMRGAPQLVGNAPGSLIAVLDACLVTGFGAVTATDVKVTAGVATATVQSAAAFEVGAVIGVSGATPAALNGDARVTASSQTSVSWATSAPDGAASGTISIRYAPMGWAKPFSGTNVAVFKPTAARATGCCLRVAATSGLAARVCGFEAMSDVNTGSGPFPTDSQQSGGGYWPCSANNNATAVPWEIYASDTGLHYVCAHYFSSSSTFAGRTGWWFGDIYSRKSGDGFRCALVSGDVEGDSGGTNYNSVHSTSANVYLARSWSQLGGSIRAGRFSPIIAPPDASSIDGLYAGEKASGGVYPNATDNALILSPLLVLEGRPYSMTTLRGRLPGILHPSQKIPAGSFSPRAVVPGTGEFAGRRLAVSPGRAYAASLIDTHGAVFFDLSDAWE